MRCCVSVFGPDQGLDPERKFGAEGGRAAYDPRLGPLGLCEHGVHPHPKKPTCLNWQSVIKERRQIDATAVQRATWAVLAVGAIIALLVAAFGH